MDRAVSSWGGAGQSGSQADRRVSQAGTEVPFVVVLVCGNGW